MQRTTNLIKRAFPSPIEHRNLSLQGFWKLDDERLTAAWLSDLLRIGYKVPLTKKAIDPATLRQAFPLKPSLSASSASKCTCSMDRVIVLNKTTPVNLRWIPANRGQVGKGSCGINVPLWAEVRQKMYLKQPEELLFPGNLAANDKMTLTRASPKMFKDWPKIEAATRTFQGKRETCEECMIAASCCLTACDCRWFW